MVGPARKREAVVHLEHKFQVSQRWACKSLTQPRSTQRYVGRQSGKDAVLAGEQRRFAIRASVSRLPHGAQATEAGRRQSVSVKRSPVKKS